MNDDFNISATVIWYNPKKEDVSNVNTYAFYFSKVFIIDNSDIDNIQRARRTPKCCYHPT